MLIGIIYGLYFEKSIAFILVSISLIIILIKQSKYKYFRYLKIFLKYNVISLLLFTAFISNTYLKVINKKYESIYNSSQEVNANAIIISKIQEEEYSYRYTVKITSKKLEGKKFILITKKSEKNRFKYGDLIEINGVYLPPNKQRNYGGFDYSLYLKTKKIYGVIRAENVLFKSSNNINWILFISNRIRDNISKKIEMLLPKEESSLLLAILIGNKEGISEETTDNFKNSSLSHILAVSGMHISYIVLGTTFFLSKSKFSKKWIYILTIIVLVIFMFITNFSPSVNRACIMGIIGILANILYRKNDSINSIAISTLILLIINPYLVTDIGFELSYLGALGIILFYKNINTLLNKKIPKYISEVFAVSISAQILIMPILAYKFNTISTNFLLSNLIATPLLGIIIILGFITIIVSFISFSLAKFLAILLKYCLQLISLSAKFISKIPFSQITIKTPYILNILLLYIFIFIFYLLFNTYNSKKIHFKKKKIRFKFIYMAIKLFLIISILLNIGIYSGKIIDNSMYIYFVDVGQGDSTLIITPKKKTILIDGGEDKNNILVPYLLDRKIKQIDYLIVSHFDSDHVGGLLNVMEKLNVKKVIISKQYEETENFERFKEIINRKRIKFFCVDINNAKRMQIENDLNIDFIWPCDLFAANENKLNNNSLVAKLNYKNFSILFTGDIEKIAENKILEKYKDKLNLLNSTVLKVAHHGSKTSSTKEFLEVVKPKIALIGVEEGNKFGHPNIEVLERLEILKTKIYRTDKMGEISIKVNKNRVELYLKINK